MDPIEAVAARMDAIAASLPPDDGVRRFNELYLAVTRAVAVASASATFEDPAFISRLDVVFADLYFAAVDDDRGGHKTRAHGRRCSRSAPSTASPRCSSRSPA